MYHDVVTSTREVWLRKFSAASPGRRAANRANSSTLRHVRHAFKHARSLARASCRLSATPRYSPVAPSRPRGVHVIAAPSRIAATREPRACILAIARCWRRVELTFDAARGTRGNEVLYNTGSGGPALSLCLSPFHVGPSPFLRRFLKSPTNARPLTDLAIMSYTKCQSTRPDPARPHELFATRADVRPTKFPATCLWNLPRAESVILIASRSSLKVCVSLHRCRRRCRIWFLYRLSRIEWFPRAIFLALKSKTVI